MTPDARISRLEAWKQSFVEEYRDDRDMARKDRADIEQRLRKLESRMYMCTGALAVLELILRMVK